jgi:hypothetical protein
VQIKIGLDKFPVPSIESEVPLYDIVTGDKLVDQSGISLVTDSVISISQVANSSKATSVVVSSNSKGVPVIEQFPEISETGTTLLGITRAETQLSLFSDVSVLGFDEDSWETYSYGSGTPYYPWDLRRSRDFGVHYGARMIEETGEQAIQLGAFPVPYSYPFGLKWQDRGYYNKALYDDYIRFITLGNFLHYYFKNEVTEILDRNGRPFYENFLDYDVVRVNSDNEVDFIGITDAEGFTLIDTWTRAWVAIQTNSFPIPGSGQIINEKYINSLPTSTSDEFGVQFELTRPKFDLTRPGYSTSHRTYVYMQSRKAYRYQPGRISGFTFGAKASTDVGSNQNIIEWGIANPTDQYIFQIQGASFSIIRRSTVALSERVIAAQGLDPATAQVFESSGDPYNSTQYYTIKIPRDNFNGDKLNGNGRSNYLLTPSNVTMYKIEFGWYGAIGAKFYVYIPVDNNEARWVLVHTLVIENELSQPCLEDPYFRFKYSVDIRNTATLKTPQFIYKYGASCFIDGGDDGTVTQRSYESGERIVSSTPKSILGIWPKQNIINKNGYEKPNKKVIYPKSISLAASKLSVVEVVRCKACPGFGFGYNHGIGADQSGRNINIEFVGSRDRIRIVPADPLNLTNDDYFTEADKNAKIIADGLWGGYIDTLDLEVGGTGLFEEAIIRRNGATQEYPVVVKPRASSELLTIPVTEPGQPAEPYPYPVRLSQYNNIAASTVPLTGSKIEILFMTKNGSETLGHITEYAIGLTDKKPIEAFDSGGNKLINWEYSVGDVRSTLPITDFLFGEAKASTTGRTRDGIEVGEELLTIMGRIDRRIPAVPGVDGGICSALTVQVLQKDIKSGTMVLNNPKPGVAPDFQYYIILSPNTQFSSDTIKDGEVGLFNGTSYIGTGVVFATVADKYEDGDDVIYFAQLSSQLPGISENDSVEIAMTPIRITGESVNLSRIFKFNPYPLYLVCMLRDNANINSISVRETVGDIQISSTPRWILDQNTFKSPDINNQAEDDLPPVNFISNNRLDAAAVDTQLDQKLRTPYTVVDTFMIGENESKEIDLSNIFGPDRINITPDVLNTEATFFIARSIDGLVGTIQASLQTAEQ